jgi:hypothetical protein
MLIIDYLCPTFQVCQMTKKEREKYGLLPPKIVESDLGSLGHGMCEYGGTTPFKRMTPFKTHSLLAFTIIKPANILVGLKLSKPQISQHHPSRICFITPCWHVTSDLNLLSFSMGVWQNSNVSSNKSVTIMALKPKQLQVTTSTPQANAIIERFYKVVNDIHRSFYLKNYYENL